MNTKTVVWSAIGIVAFLLVIGVLTYNGIAGRDQNVNAAFGVIQADLQRRADLIPNEVEIVKGYAAHEDSVFTEVTEARTRAQTVINIDASKLANDPALQKQLADAQAQMNGALTRLLAVAEAYPDLKASQVFINLQTDLSGTENRIKDSRRKAQAAIADYNTAIVTFPGNVIAGFGHFTPKTFYQADEGADKAPTIDFKN